MAEAWAHVSGARYLSNRQATTVMRSLATIYGSARLSGLEIIAKLRHHA
jgi:hypothetical protein